MSGFLAIARRHSRRTIVFFLCFLALSFAMEAKVGWYEPTDGFSQCAHCERMPTDSREIESESSNALGAVGRNPACTSLAILAAIFPMRHEGAPSVTRARTHLLGLPFTAIFSLTMASAAFASRIQLLAAETVVSSSNQSIPKSVIHSGKSGLITM